MLVFFCVCAFVGALVTTCVKMWSCDLALLVVSAFRLKPPGDTNPTPTEISLSHDFDTQINFNEYGKHHFLA